MNRLQRDQILTRALDMVGSIHLDTKERPTGTIDSGAQSINWLQDAIDLFHHEFPWQARISSSAISITPSNAVGLPSDFILDFRHGVVVPSSDVKRLRRTSVQSYISRHAYETATGKPARYAILGDVLKVHPTPDDTYAGTLWYYSLPTTLGSTGVPSFPSDWLLVEYVRLRGLEHLKQIQPGTAMQMARSEIQALRRAGLHGEPEDDTVPIDLDTFLPSMDSLRGSATTNWMGSSAL
jgi:hypothetical protein